MTLPSTTAPRLIVGSGVVLLCAAVWYATIAPASFGGPLSLVLIRGTSMEPTYVTGDLVIGYRSGDLSPGDVVIFRGPGDAPVIHRLRVLEGDRLVTRGDNLDVDDPWETNRSDVLGTARVLLPGVGGLIRALGRPPVLGALAAVLVTSLVLLRQDARSEPGDGSGREAVPVVPEGARAGRIGTALAVVAVCGLGGLFVAYAASLTVVARDLTGITVVGPFDTFVDAPGGGTGGPGGGGGGSGGGGGPGGGGPPGGGGGRP